MPVKNASGKIRLFLNFKNISFAKGKNKKPIKNPPVGVTIPLLNPLKIGSPTIPNNIYIVTDKKEILKL